MNLLLLHPADFIGEHEVRLTDRRLTHLRKTLRASRGQRLQVGLLNGPLGEGTISAIDREQVILQVQLSRAAPAPAPLAILVALPRPLMFKRILQAISSFGIKQIHFLHSEKVEKSYWNSSDLAPAVVQEQLILGLEQSVDTLLPQVFFHQHFNDFVKNELPVVQDGKRCLLAHPGPYSACPANLESPALLAIGPEGGFSESEVNTFLVHGFEAVQLGHRILRVETAVSALLGRLLPCP